jgi:hypothetical protein
MGSTTNINATIIHGKALKCSRMKHRQLFNYLQLLETHVNTLPILTGITLHTFPTRVFPRFFRDDCGFKILLKPHII